MSELERKLSRRRLLNGEGSVDCHDGSGLELGLELAGSSTDQSSLSFTSSQLIEKLLWFIKSPSRGGSNSSSSSNSSVSRCSEVLHSREEVSLQEFEAAFRKHKNIGSSRDREASSRGLMEKLEHLLGGNNLSVEDWFLSSDTRGAGLKKKSSGGVGDGKLTQLELADSIARLCRNLNLPAWSKQDVLNLLRYMDPNADSNLSMAEAIAAFKKYHGLPDYCKLRLCLQYSSSSRPI
jgi:hypothetical protein